MQIAQTLPRRFLTKNFWKENSESLMKKIEKHEILLLSGSFAYTTALALAPFLIIMISILSVLGSDTQASVVSQMTSLLGSEAGEAMKTIADNAEKEARFSGVSGVLSFLIILISASAMFSQMRTALDKVNEYVPDQESSGFMSFLKERVFSVGLVLGFIFLLVVSLFVTAGLALVFSDDQTAILRVISFAVNFAVFSMLFSAMFRFIPSKSFPWKRCLVSGFWAAGFFLIGKNLIGLYLGKSAVGSAYGAAGSLVVLLVWLYYSALTLLLSYEFTNTVVFYDEKSTMTSRDNFP